MIKLKDRCDRSVLVLVCIELDVASDSVPLASLYEKLEVAMIKHGFEYRVLEGKPYYVPRPEVYPICVPTMLCDAVIRAVREVIDSGMRATIKFVSHYESGWRSL
ncbi:hypothetical protein [Burkholderia vietnamiensis]|uniref:hypothetical protein n=1 Tax=Burkholderia vietnamiensis TaxID=60552 RepID=UPI000AC0D8AB|nr:hypothetical protein [Burkholderia vietnamiensis]